MARICIPLSWVKENQGNAKEAIEIALRGLKIVEKTERYFEIVQLCMVLSEAYEHSDKERYFEFSQQAYETAQKSGNSFLMGDGHYWIGALYMIRGDENTGLKYIHEAIQIHKKIGYTFGVWQKLDFLGRFYTGKKQWNVVIEHCLDALKIAQDVGNTRWIRQSQSLLANAYAQTGDLDTAVDCCKKALEVGVSGSIFVARILSIMEASLAGIGKREKLIPYCTRLREEKRNALQDLKLSQWYLEPAGVGAVREPPLQSIAFADEFDQPALKSEWKWVNPKGDSSYSLSCESSWLEMRAASGSNLYQPNFDAPRLLQEISGNFAAEVKMKAASDDLPSVGGILAWKDEQNYIRFERGINGKDEIGLSGSVGGKFNHFGRGMLSSNILYLRLERTGNRILSYCSDNGINWLTCGKVSFSVEDPIQVGIHAIGNVGISNVGMMYRGEATATRFDYFKVMR